MIHFGNVAVSPPDVVIDHGYLTVSPFGAVMNNGYLAVSPPIIAVHFEHVSVSLVGAATDHANLVVHILEISQFHLLAPREMLLNLQKNRPHDARNYTNLVKAKKTRSFLAQTWPGSAQES